MIEEFLARIEKTDEDGKKKHDFAAYLAPRLLGESTDAQEMNRVCNFIEKHTLSKTDIKDSKTFHRRTENS